MCTLEQDNNMENVLNKFVEQEEQEEEEEDGYYANVYDENDNNYNI